MSTETIELASRSQVPRIEQASCPPGPTVISSEEHKDEPVRMDGGYGWVILAICSTSSFYFTGLTYSWGVFQAQLVTDDLASASTLSFIGSLMIACLAIFAIVSARLLRVMGSKRMAFSGTLLMGGGQILAGWCTKSVPGLFVTVGLVTGLGISWCFTVCFSLPAQYFSRRKGLAMGIVYCSGGTGGAVLSIGTEGLISSVGIAWAFRIVGISALVLVGGTSLLIKERAVVRPKSLVDWKMLRDPRFLVLFASGAVGVFPLFVPPFFIPLYGRALSLTAGQSAGLVAGFNLSSAVGRLAFGFVSDHLGPINSMLLTLVIEIITVFLIWPLSTTLAPLVVFCVANGLASGGYFALWPVVVGSVFGAEMLARSMSMMVTAWAPGYLLGAPVAGYILNAAGGSTNDVTSYRPAMYYAGALAAASFALVVGIRFYIDRQVWRKV